MKKTSLLLALSAVSMIALSGCFNFKPKKSSSSTSESETSSTTSSQSASSETSSSSSSIVEKTITVNYYLDYNQIVGGNIYYSCEATNGHLITDIPSNPEEPPLPEFPVFKGWSEKEIIDNLDDLWDFENDILNTQKNTFNLFGIWVAQGE